MQILQTVNNPLQLGRLAPVFLGREVNKPFRSFEGSVLGNKHVSDPHLLTFNRVMVGAEVLGESLLEHEGDALTHDSHRINCVHHSLSWSVEQITLEKLHHSEIPTLLYADCELQPSPLNF